MNAPLRLGLIGDNIAASSSPLLHLTAGELTGQGVRYDRLVPAELDCDFDTLFDRCRDQGYRGLNITYPYKERVCDKVQASEPLIEAIGAVNTVRFSAQGAISYNTDYSGFIAAYESVRGKAAPGVTTLIGSGGVGRAIAFGLGTLGASEIRIFDRQIDKAHGLADDLRAQFPNLTPVVATSIEEACDGAQGLVNGTPIGMVGYEGTPVPAPFLAGAIWVFDAVYTPLVTQFLADAQTAGLEIISGWELFFWQGRHAWSIFSDLDVDTPELRKRLEQTPKSTPVDRHPV